MATHSYPYRITLRMYSGLTEHHYIEASNYGDAFDKAHRFANPIAYSGKYHGHTDGVQFIDVDKLTRTYCAERGIQFE